MSKKRIIAIVTVIVLLLAAGISVGVFLYGRAETEAADGSQTSTTDQNQVSDGNAATDGTQTGEDDENATNPNEGDENTESPEGDNADEAGDNETVENENANADNQTANNNNTVDNDNAGNAGVTTDTNVNNVGETTITRVEEQDRLVSEHFLDWWKPMLVKVNQKTALGVNVPQLTVEKTAITGVGGNEFVYAGQEITYVIAVTNNSDETVENIEITDKIPQNTAFVSIEDAIILKEIDGQLTSEVVGTKTTVGPEKSEVGVKWVVTIPAGETVIAKFTVKVTATEGIIENTAIANGQESKDPTNAEDDEKNATKTSIIKANKSSVITRDGKEVEIAKVGDLITYTITVENTGDVEGTTYITDKVPAGTEFVSTPVDEGAIVSEAKDSIAWSITLGAKETITKTFTVKVIKVNGAIVNIAKVGGTETEPDITETAGITPKKEVIEITRNGESIGITSEVKDKDVIKYKITVTNNGSQKLTDIEVNDKLAGIVLDGQKVNKITIKELAAGASREINAEYTVTYNTDIYKNEARLIENEVEVKAKTEVDPENPDETPEDVKDDDKTETEVEKLSLISVKKEVAGIKAVGTDEYKLNTTNTTVRPGDIIKYTITVENTGNTILENIKVTEYLDVNVGSETGSSEISDIKELRPGETETIDVYYTVTTTDVNVTEQTFINNKVEVSGTTKTDPENPDEKPEEVGDDYTDSTVEVNPDVDIPVSKVWNDNDDQHQIRPQSITFNLLANDVKVATSEPVSGTSYVFENFKKYDENKQPITYTVTENAVGGYESKAEPNTKTGGYTVTNTDKIRQEKTSVITRDGVAVTDKVAKVGDIIEYTITVYNDSNTDAIVTVTDELPSGVELVDFTTTSSTLRWENKKVPADDKLEITFNVKVTSVDNGTIENTAKVGNTETTPNQVKVEAYIVFEENGGSEVSDITGIAGEEITNTTMPTTTTKTGYTLEGWYDNSELTGNAVENLPATYPAGTTTYYAKWVPATDTKYIVNHHLEDLNADTYTLDDTENLEGTTGAQTAAVARTTYTGFTAKAFEQKEIAADGSTVVDIYYTRNSYTITYNIVGDYFAQAGYAEKTYEYGATVEAEAEPVKVGYNFSGWATVPNNGEIPTTMPAENVTVEGSYTTRDDTKYIVNHHLEDLNADTYTLDDTENLEGTTGAQTAAVPRTTYTGFTAKAFEQKQIAADGSTVVDIYYTRNSYKITYNIVGDYFAQAGYAEKTYEYGATVEAEAEPVKVGYNFSGWATVPNNGEIPTTMPAENVTVEGSYTTRNDTKYIVNHHLEDLNADTYTLDDTENLEGTTGAQTAAVARTTYTGFTAKAFEQKEIAADGSTVVDIYYTRNSYKITYNIVGDYFAQAGYAEKTYEYGATVEAVAEPVQVGYRFCGWALVTENENKDIPTTMPAENVTVEGSYTTRNDTKYTVNHHLEDLNADTYTLDDTENLEGTTGAQTAAVARTTYTGFTAKAFEQKEIAADGSTVVDIYYTRNSYTITYNIVGEYFAQAGYAEKTYEYGATVVAEAEPVKVGYNFSGWATVPNNGEIPTTMPAENVTVEGSYTTRNDTKYTVKYYYEINGNYPSTTELNDVREGTTGAPVAVTEADKTPAEGYVFDEEYSGNILDGTIAADGSLVLKVYFKQQLKVVYAPGTQGTFKQQEYTVKYGNTPTAFNGTPTGNAGFNFAGWDKDVTTPVKEDTTYTAIWEGLQVTKTRLAIVDKDNLGNTDYVDQDGDIIRYAITVKNIGDIKAENIVLKDSLAVKVVSVVIAETEVEIANRGSNEFAANTNLLQGLTAEIEPNKTIVVTVEHTVTDAEVKAALDADSKIVNTATALLNENPYTGTDKTTDPEDGTEEEGTEVKQRCEYRVEYHYNGQLGTAEDDVIESAAIVGATISFEKPAERKGFTYVNYVGSTTVAEGTNLIIVNYGKAVTTIEKSGSATVDAGANIEYTLTVKNTGYVETTVTVSDELVGTTYVAGSANIGEPSITNNVLTWQVTVGAASAGTPEVTQTITFKATAPKDAFGETIANTAHIKNGETTVDSSDEVSTGVNEVTVNYREWKEGQQGTDLNIIFLLDNSASMNEPIEGDANKYSNDSYYVAPGDVSKTRLYNAKEAIKGFITNQSTNPNTSMSVITFNSDYADTMDRYVLVKNEDIKTKTENGKTIRYATINGTDYEVSDDTITATDGNDYCYVTITINEGPVLVGTNSTSNDALKTAVNNISIGSRREGLGTNIKPALDLITANASTYLSSTKKNIVIVLADGDFDEGYEDLYIPVIGTKYYEGIETSKTELLAAATAPNSETPNLEIYSVKFGNFDGTKLTKLSTNNTCYSATNASTILSKFTEILSEATGSEQTGLTDNGEITFAEATLDIIVSENCPIEATYNVPILDENGNPVLDDEGNPTYETETLFECTSPGDLATYGLTITDKKTISWNAKTFIANHPTATVPNTVYIKYYVPRESADSSTDSSADSSTDAGTDANS